MTRTITKAIVVIAAAAALAGCAGTRFSFANARQVKVGMTTAEMQDLMGRPYSVTTRGDNEIWIWSQANGFTGSHSAVSFTVKDGVVIGVPRIPDNF
jgi:outer membrane protein assembly factor BamE (lipoprotein component of BamABCDE complex)